MNEPKEEYTRFLNARQRRLCLPEIPLLEKLSGKTIMVTGGTGCIGTALITQLARYYPARITSVTRGYTQGPRKGNATYLTGDVRSPVSMLRAVKQIKPDIIFHLAAQRSPALAEIEVRRTVSTNTLGARNILEAAITHNIPQLVTASTGKALRPYSPEIYTASKRAAEWVTMTASDQLLVSSARFTHVMDNSIIHQKLLDWADDRNAVIRLHSDTIGFYVQSALESAQLLLIALLGARKGEFRVHAIADLGWPVNLLDMTRGLLETRQSPTPITISGYDPGYEETPFPGLYDPTTAGDVSPLVNMFEAAALTDSPCPMTDAFRLEMTLDPLNLKLLGMLGEACERATPGPVRYALDDLSWSLLDATLAAADKTTLARSAELAGRVGMTAAHRRVAEAVRRGAGC